MFGHLLDTRGAIEFDQVYRFAHDWGRQASLRLRRGGLEALGVYADTAASTTEHTRPWRRGGCDGLVGGPGGGGAGGDDGDRPTARSPECYTYRTRGVYDTCMGRVRTNIEIDEGYVRTIMDRYGIHTKTEAVDLALRHLAGQPMTREQALAMRGQRAMSEIPDDVAPQAWV